MRRQVGAWLTGLRRDAEITALELAEQIGAQDAESIALFETGDIRVPSHLFAGYARTFGLPVAEFARTCLRHYDPAAYRALFDGFSEASSQAA